MRRLIVAAVALGDASNAAAQPNPTFEFAKSDEVAKVKDVEWTASAEGGLVFTTGNAETTTITAGLKAARKTGRNKLTLEGSLTYVRSGLLVLSDTNGNGTIDSEAEIATASTTTANTLSSKLRYDRFLTKSNSLFVALLASRDVPAGKEVVLGGQLGYSRLLYKTQRNEAVAELGYDYSHEDLVTGDGVSIHSARGFVGYKGEMATGTTVDASVEALANLIGVTLPTMKDGGIGQDTRVNTRIGISSKLDKSLAIQTSIEVKYDHRPGPLAIKNLAMGFVPEAATMDTIMKASFIYTFF